MKFWKSLNEILKKFQGNFEKVSIKFWKEFKLNFEKSLNEISKKKSLNRILR